MAHTIGIYVASILAGPLTLAGLLGYFGGAGRTLGILAVIAYLAALHSHMAAMPQ